MVGLRESLRRSSCSLWTPGTITLALAWLSLSPAFSQTSPSVEGFAAAAPRAVLASVTESFPGFSVYRVVVSGPPDEREYEVTLFDPRSTMLRVQAVDGADVYTRKTYKIVLRATGEVIVEEAHVVSEHVVPQAAREAIHRWRATRPKGMVFLWTASRERGEPRRYGASIIVNAVEAHFLEVSQDGTVVSESEHGPE